MQICVISLVLAIFCFIGGFINFAIAVKEWPVRAYYKGLPNGRYTTATDFVNDEIRVENVYGETVITYVRKEEHDLHE